MNRWISWRPLWGLAAIGLLFLVGVGQADTTQDRQRDKKAAQKPDIVQVDLNALPKDLAKELKRALQKLQQRDTRPTEQPKAKKTKAKKDEDARGTSSLESQLDRLAREIENLRRELRKKKD